MSIFVLFWEGGRVLTRRRRMLAVMTMNVGFFMSVLAGVFVGELVVGRFGHSDGGHH